VLGHRYSTGSGDNGRSRADIDGIGGIPTCAAGVNQSAVYSGMYANRRVSHLFGKTRDLRYGFALQSQGNEQRPYLGISRFIEDLAHEGLGLLHGEVTPFHDILQISQSNITNPMYNLVLYWFKTYNVFIDYALWTT
jgi:hypothetical protein